MDPCHNNLCRECAQPAPDHCVLSVCLVHPAHPAYPANLTLPVPPPFPRLLLQWMMRRGTGPLCSAAFSFPTNKYIDAPLLAGSAMFGAGWAIAGTVWWQPLWQQQPWQQQGLWARQAAPSVVGPSRGVADCGAQE